MAFDVPNTEQQLDALLGASYRSRSPLRTLWALFAGRRGHLTLTVILFVIKQSPVWAFPIVTGNIITLITGIYAQHQAHQPIDPGTIGHILINALVMFVLIAQNVPMHTLYAMALSSVVRNVQLVLRSSLVVRLQQLSMSFHDRTETGKLQSKVLRDVEAVEALVRLLHGFGAAGRHYFHHRAGDDAAEEPDHHAVFPADGACGCSSHPCCSASRCSGETKGFGASWRRCRRASAR